jgi:hypothetical protein
MEQMMCFLGEISETRKAMKVCTEALLAAIASIKTDKIIAGLINN